MAGFTADALRVGGQQDAVDQVGSVALAAKGRVEAPGQPAVRAMAAEANVARPVLTGDGLDDVVDADLIGAEHRVAGRAGHAGTRPVGEMAGVLVDAAAVAARAGHDELEYVEVRRSGDVGQLLLLSAGVGHRPAGQGAQRDIGDGEAADTADRCGREGGQADSPEALEDGA